MNDTKTVSGTIVHLTDADEAPLVKCLVDITPKQSGTGTPSPDNVRAISGWESVSVDVAGKNLLNIHSVGSQRMAANGITFTLNEDGTVTANGTATGTAQIYWINIPSATYAETWSGKVLNGCPSISGCSLRIEKETSPWTNYATDTGNGATIGAIPPNIGNLAIYCRVAQGTTLNNAVFKPMIRVSGASAEYEPYNTNSHTTTTSLGRTVYGGTLDVVTGVLTVDKVGVDLGSLTWSKYGNYTDKDRYVTTGIDSNANNDEANAICSIYPHLWGANGWWIGSGSGKLSIFTTYGQYSSVSAFKTAMSGQILCYPLATPQTYTLTGQEVSAMYGENYIWANSGPVEITYRTNVLGIYNKIYINGRPYFRPNDFQLAREDVYAGEYTSCTGKLIADKIGWKYSDLPMKWDILPDEDLVYLTTLTGSFDIIFRDSDGQHTETVIRRAFTNTPTRTTGPEGSKIWTGVEMEVSFLNTHPINE